jgi:uncharacterized protein YhdP
VVLRWSRLLVRTVVATVATVVVLAALLVWRVAQGPISLGVLVPYISEALALPQLGIRAEIGDVVLAWSEQEESIRLRVIDARYRGADDRVGLVVPNIDMMLSGRAALRGVIAPRFVHVSGIDARLVRDAAGHFQVGLPAVDEAAGTDTPVTPPAPETDAGMVQAMVAGLFEMLSRPQNFDDSMGQLENVSILADRLVIEDWKLNQRWIIPAARILFQRGEGHVFASAAGALDWRDRRVDLNVDADYNRADRSARVTVRFSEIEPSDFADVVPELAPLGYVAAPISGTLTLDMNESGERLGLGFDLAAGAGQINAPDLLPAPLALQQARFRGQADAAKGILRFEEASLAFADKFRLSLGGTVTRSDGERYGIDLKGQFFDLPTDRLAGYWPPMMAKNARDWVTTRITGGMVGTGRFEAALTPEMVAGRMRLPPQAVKLDFTFDNLSVNYLPPMTRLTEAKGVATLNADVFDLTLESAKAGPVTIAGGSTKITGLQDVDQHAEIQSLAHGRTADILALIDQKPLGFPSRMGIKPATVGGGGQVKWKIRFPLFNSLKVEDIAVNAEAAMGGLTMPGLMGRYDLSDGDMTMTVDAKGLETNGRAALNGVPLQIGWKQDFNARAALQARYSLKGRIDEAQRKALGYPLAPYIDGPADVVMDIEERRGGEVAVGGEFDLTATTIVVAEAHLGKGAGEPAKGRIQVRTRPGQPVQFDLIEVSGRQLSARAKAVLEKDGGWNADIQSLTFGESDAQGRIAFAANGDSRVELTGKRYDLRRFLEEVMGDDTEPGTVKPRMALALRFDEARIDDTLEMRNLSVSATRAPTRMERVSVTGGFATTGGLTLSITPALEGRRLQLDSDNAGAVLQFLGVSDVQGGTMQVLGAYDDTQKSQPLSGRMTMKNLRAVRTPFLARLLGIGSFTGLANLLSGEGIVFETGEVPFEQKDGVLTLKPSRLSGPQLGITFEGTVNSKTDSLSVNGTAVPAFVLNTMLGKIPLLGGLLVGDGIIGVNFAVSGAKSDPQFTINPLSVIAPGFLRRIFQAPEVRAPSPDDPPAPPVQFQQQQAP